jgi:hypothetical protein
MPVRLSPKSMPLRQHAACQIIQMIFLWKLLTRIEDDKHILEQEMKKFLNSCVYDWGTTHLFETFERVNVTKGIMMDSVG